jgi:hypothetical protein
VTEHGLALVELDPGRSAILQERKSLFPATIKAYSNGQLVHEHVVTWNELEENNFVYVIDGTIDPTTSTPIPR